MHLTQAGEGSIPLLETKFFVPAPRAQRVARPRLFELLDAGCPLTLVSAPAGFGKTTLVCDWLRSRRQPAGWLSLDPADSEPRRFLSYLAGAVAEALPGVGDGLAAVLRMPQLPPREVLLTPLLNELSRRAAALTLVLDDYHVVEHPEVHATVELLVDRLPPGVRLVITTRADPPFALPRMRARGLLREVRAEHLRFHDPEIVTFLDEVMGLSIEPSRAAALGERTEGWIAGLQLAALSLRRQHDFEAFVDGFTDTNRYVLDYLAGEVLAGLAPEVLDFLLTVSVAERFCGPLCDALTGRRDGQAQLEAAEAANLFIVPLDDHRGWYRFHHLFRSLLRRQLAGRRSKAERRDLHRRACDWLTGQSLPDEALEHALAARDRERSLDIVGAHAGRRVRGGDVGTVMRWFDALPAAWADSRVRLVIDRALALFLGFRWQEMAETLEVSRSLVDDDGGDLLAAEQAALESCLATTRAEPRRAIQLARRALDHLPVDDLLLRTSAAVNLGSALIATGDYDEARRALRDARRWNRTGGNKLAVVAAGHLEGALDQLLGRLHGALDRHRRTLEAVEATPADPVAAFLLAGQADVHVEWGELDRARELAERAVELSAGILPVAALRGLVTLAAVHRSRRDPAVATAVLRRLEKLLGSVQVAPWELMREAHLARIWCCEMDHFGDERAMARLARWVEEHRLLEGDEVTSRFLPDDPKEAALMCAVRLLLARGEADRALEILAALRAEVEARGWRRPQIETWLLEAEAHHRREPERAHAALGRALGLAAPEGYVQVVADEGPWLLELLASAPDDPLADLPAGFRGRLAEALGLDRGAAKPPARPGSAHAGSDDAPAERLSARELEVLAAVAEGLSNLQAAKRLYISPSTVKKHLENIYGKLGVHNRVEAIARCRALGLFSE